MDKPLHQFSDTNSIVAISWCPFEKEIVLACTEEKLLLLNVKKGEVGILVEKSFYLLVPLPYMTPVCCFSFFF